MSRLKSHGGENEENPQFCSFGQNTKRRWNQFTKYYQSYSILRKYSFFAQTLFRKTPIPKNCESFRAYLSCPKYKVKGV